MKLGRGRNSVLAAALFALALTLGAAGCGEEETTHVVEGEPIELGDLSFNVQLTRFLNPEDVGDAEYLEGLPLPASDQDYLAVFMVVENEGDDPIRLPSAVEMKVVDTTGASFSPVETNSVFALPLGALLAPGESAPGPETAAAQGPTQGSFVLFLVDEAVSASRPLELDILADGEEGTVELDI